MLKIEFQKGNGDLFAESTEVSNSVDVFYNDEKICELNSNQILDLYTDDSFVPSNFQIGHTKLTSENSVITDNLVIKAISYDIDPIGPSITEESDTFYISMIPDYTFPDGMYHVFSNGIEKGYFDQNYVWHSKEN